MKLHDHSNNSKIAKLIKLTQDLQQSRTADETLRAFHRGFKEDDGSVVSLLLSTSGVGADEVRVVQMHLANQPDTGGLETPMLTAMPAIRSRVLGEILARPEPQLIQDVNWSGDSYFSSIFDGYTSVISVPFSSERLPVNWIVLLKKTPHQFTVSDLEETIERVAIGGALLENQMLTTELAYVYDRIDREAKEVGALQRALLPASLPQIAGMDIATSYEPCGRAGGDLYDFFPLDEHAVNANAPGRWCIFIGDVAGHGLAAAVVMGIVQAVLHSRPLGLTGPASLLSHANRQLCDKQIGGFCTAFLGVYDPETRVLTYTNAGHPPLLLRRTSTAEVATLNQAASLPLGIVDTETFYEASLHLEPGDTVLLYTDGIIEIDQPGENMIPMDRLAHVLSRSGNRPEQVVEQIRASFRPALNVDNAADDQTIVVALAL